jgi:hypothetical protein
VNVARVQAWRARHPGYWRKVSALRYKMSQWRNPLVLETAISARSLLQDVLTAQPAVLIGLIAHIVGNAVTR